MTEFELALQNHKEPERNEYRHRLYYDAETGQPLFMTTEVLDGSFVEITADEYDTLNLNRVRIRNGVLEKFDFRPRNVLLLRLDPAGEFTTMSDDMMIVADSGDNYTIQTDE